MTTGVVLIILLAYGAAMLWIGRRARTHAGSFQDAIAAPRQPTSSWTVKTNQVS